MPHPLVPLVPNLAKNLGDLLSQIPAGRVTTYGRLAQALGDSIASRWVGHFGLHHSHDGNCHCHRVVRATGHLGLYVAGDTAAKARRLSKEGVIVEGTRPEEMRVDLNRYEFDDFQTDYPLKKLRRLQHDLAAKVRLSRRTRIPPQVAGVDVSYTPSARGSSGESSTDWAVAAYVLVDSDNGSVVWSTTVSRPAVFPYITTYLTFRELPILLELMKKVHRAGRDCPVIMVDGTGILHPRRAGIASFLGVAAAQPTVGVIKKRLCGRVDIDDMRHLESRPVMLDEQQVGAAIRPTRGSHRPIFVSPGHRVDIDFATELARRMLFGRRLPQPLYEADRLSRSVARNLRSRNTQ
ncbi:MAG: endonuclease V [Pirellulales bacterium]|nr:endonuclease V [Pirellulales bacterium]